MSDIFYEPDKKFSDILNEKKNFLFIGEAGSGKTEIVLNVAAWLAEHGDGSKVDVFDMDQTKPLFRSRDMEEQFAEKGVEIHYQVQYLDAPTRVGGIEVSLMSDNYTIMDIGGGEQAARAAGTVAHILKRTNSVPVYIINPYRPWTKNIESLDLTMGTILRAVRLDRIYLLGNPNVGYTTEASEFMEGLDRIDDLLKDFTKVSSACVRRELYDQVKDETDKDVFPLDLYMTYSWVDR